MDIQPWEIVWRPDGPQKKYKIHGTNRSFSSKPDDLDEKAVEEFSKIIKKGIQGMEVHGDVFGRNPEQLPKGLFLATSTFNHKEYTRFLLDQKIPSWRVKHSNLGYGIGSQLSGYKGFKETYVYHNSNHETNQIMVIYHLIHENSYIKANDVVLCHLFQSDNYNPRPKPLLSSVSSRVILEKYREEVDSCMVRLEDLMRSPESFSDLDEFNESYINCDGKWKANRRNGKRADVWEHFTDIKVLEPDGKVMLTLAICHGCSMAYLTGKWDPRKGSLSNNGTKTLKEHYHKCSGGHHIAGNPQGAHRQMP